MQKENNSMSRRDFARAATVAAGALSSSRLSGADKGGVDLKLGLYSITYLGVWYRGDALSIEQVIDRVISEVETNPIPAEDLERVKTQLIAEAIYAQDNQATLARWYGGALTTGLSIDDIRSWPDRIRAVTSEQVREAAQKWLDKKRSVTGYLIKDAAPKREEKRS